METLDATGCVNQFLFAGEERMRCTGYFYREERVFLAIFPDDGLIGLDGRTSEKGESRRCVLEYDRAILGMNAVFHAF